METPPSHQILIDYAPERMSIEASEDEFVSFSIRLLDQRGNPIVGETINLQTNLGQFRVEKVKPIPVEVEKWVEVEEKETSVFVPQKATVIQDRIVVTYSQEVNLVTDNYGTARVALLPPDQPGVATIGVATIEVSTSQQEITLFYVFATLEGLHLTSDSFCAVGDYGAQIIARLYDAAGKPVSGQVVTFQTTLGQLSSLQATTDEKGEAVVTLFGTGVEGTAVVTASALGYTDKIYVDIFRQLGTYNPSGR
ncbi:MAG: Ig-like domain-containing protein [Armatimonadetes bacterium]|nr:Ig-like domain-containing protein [Armatimonadota bacterium]